MLKRARTTTEVPTNEPISIDVGAILKHKRLDEEVAAAAASLFSPAKSEDSSEASAAAFAEADEGPVMDHDIPFLTADFVTSVHTAAKQLEDDGYAVIRNVISQEECAEMWEMMWDFIERTSQGRVKSSDPATWRKEWPVALHWILKNFNVGQSQPVWRARANLTVIAIFAILHGTDKLFCSYDGFAMVPDAARMEAARGLSGIGEKLINDLVDDKIDPSVGLRENDWFHADQSPYLGDTRLCVQSWVTVRPINKGAATLSVVKGSHKLLKSYADKGLAPTHKKTGSPDLAHWFKPTEDQKVAVMGADWRGNIVRIGGDETGPLNPGDMALWDSRTLHQGGVPLKGYPDAQKDRGVIYLCYADAKQCERNGRGAERRLELARTNRTTAHWPQFLNLNATKPRTYGQEMPPTTDLSTERDDLIAAHPELGDRIKKLIGETPFGDRGLLGWERARPTPLSIYDPVKTIKDFRRHQNRKRKAE